MELLAAPYPINPSPLGALRTVGTELGIKGDLLQLILTNPGERVMMPNYGTPLRRLFFQQNSPSLIDQTRNMILDSIRAWEPRIVVRSLIITNSDDGNQNILKNTIPDYQNNSHILLIKLQYSILSNIQGIQNLVLQVPLTGGLNA